MNQQSDSDDTGRVNEPELSEQNELPKKGKFFMKIIYKTCEV